MEQIWCLIKNGTVVNVIVADDDFITKIQSQYDHAIRVDGCEVRPGMGMTYNAETYEFTDLVNNRVIEVSNNQTVNVYPIEEEQE